MSFFEITQTDLTNQMLVEMTHQIFIFLKNIFSTGLFVKNFDSRFIGVRKFNGNVNALFGQKNGFYSHTDLVYVFKNVENLTYHCDYWKETKFASLVKVFMDKKNKTEFAFKNESRSSVCKAMNMYNLLKLLEVSLYKASKMTRPKDALFEGCLNHTIDKGKKCPTVILATFGMKPDKSVFKQSARTKRLIEGLERLRDNFLNYTTDSLMVWVENFLKDLLNSFRTQNINLHLKLILKMIQKFKKGLVMIKSSRIAENAPNKYQPQEQQMTHGLIRLKSIRDKMLGKSPSKSKLSRDTELDLQIIPKQNSKVISEIDAGVQNQADKALILDDENIINNISNEKLTDFDKFNTDSNGSFSTQESNQMYSEVEQINKDTQQQFQNGQIETDKQNNSTNFLKDDEPYEFENEEEVAFVHRIDPNGLEYLSFEINLGLINPQKFGFENYSSDDFKELQKRVQEYYLKGLQEETNLEGIMVTVDESSPVKMII